LLFGKILFKIGHSKEVKMREGEIERMAGKICEIFSFSRMLKFLIFLVFSIITLIGISAVLVLLHHHLFVAGYIVASATFLIFLLGIFLSTIFSKI
jgi:hypothetical protein